MIYLCVAAGVVLGAATLVLAAFAVPCRSRRIDGWDE